MKIIKKWIAKVRKWVDDRNAQKFIANLLKGVSEKDLLYYQTIIETELNYLKCLPLVDTKNAPNRGWKECLKITKMTLDHLMVLRQVVGIQPMTRPTSLIFSMQQRVEDDILRLSIERAAVSAQTKTLKAGYNVELLKDLKSVQGLDVKEEFNKILSFEIATEIINEVLTELVNVAKESTEVEPKNLMFEVTRAATKIATDTQRGFRNFVIGSPDAIEKLAEATGVDLKIKYGVGLEYVGMINNYRIFVSTSSAFISNTKLLVGFKGNTEYDTALIYCPYVLLMFSPIVDVNTYEIRMKTATRYALWKLESSATSSVSAKEYYRVLEYKE